MLVRERCEQTFGEERKGLKFVAANRQGEESHIHSAGAEALQQNGSNFLVDRDLNLGELAREQSEARRKKIRRNGGNNADRERAADGILALPDIALGGLEFAEDCAGARKESFSQIGKADGAAQAVKKTGAEFSFEFENLLRKRRLGDVGLLGRAAEGAGFGNSAEVAELVQLHLGRLCSARLQAGTIDSSTCSPEGERYGIFLRVVARAFTHRRSLSMIGEVYIGSIAAARLTFGQSRSPARRGTMPRGLRVH